MTTKIFVGTRKGGFVLSSENRDNWKISDPILFGNSIYHMVPDPRDKNTVLLSTRTGHLGPTIFRSEDGGKTWKEATKPPAFPKETGKTVNFSFWLTPGHSSEPRTWFVGTSPQSLFKTTDNGETWEYFDKFNENELIKKITTDNTGTPAGPLTHSININPRDKNKMVVALSTGGCFVTEDGGETWIPRNQNLLAEFLPDPYPEWGQCIHNMQMHPANPDIIYQQNHCGVYRINIAEEDEWENIGKNLPNETSDRGFPLIVHPRDEKRVWTVPMDASDVWSRTSIDGKPALYHTTDGGESWFRQDEGFPQDNAWFTVLRQATAHDFQDPLGLYVGNKSGEIWFSANEGENWRCIRKNLPAIYSIEINNS